MPLLANRTTADLKQKKREVSIVNAISCSDETAFFWCFHNKLAGLRKVFLMFMLHL